jgi:hypothetical protein
MCLPFLEADSNHRLDVPELKVIALSGIPVGPTESKQYFTPQATIGTVYRSNLSIIKIWPTSNNHRGIRRDLCRFPRIFLFQAKNYKIGQKARSRNPSKPSPGA